MKALKERELQDLLRADGQPEPPADLAARIKAEIPDVLPFAVPADDAADRAGDDAGSVVDMPERRFQPHRWALAATVVLALGGAWLASRLFEVPSEPLMQSTAPAAVGKSEAAVPSTPPPQPAGRVEEEAPSGARQQLRRKQERRAADRNDSLRAEPGVGLDDLAAPMPAPPPPPPRAAVAAPELPKPTVAPPARAPQRRVGASADRSSQAQEREAEALEQRRAELEKQLAQAARRARAQKLDPQALVQFDKTPKERALGRVMEESEAPAGVEDVLIAVAESPLLDERKIAADTAVQSPATPSTGGTAEPNDAPYGDVFLEGYGVNPFIDTEDDRLSTFGLDVDTASYALVRRYLRDGHLPPADAVRIEELINYFDYGDAAPRQGDFAIHAEGAPARFAEGERYQLLRFHLHGREVKAADRPPASLTFVIDVSGSMGQNNRLGLVKQSLRLLVDELQDDDRIAVVIYGSTAQVVLEPTADRVRALQAIDALQTGGSTNAEDGLVQGYALATRTARRGAINRVILCSDGVANVGRTGPESILERIGRYAEQGIELTTVGFGLGNYNDVLMEQLANRGNGRYAYVDTLDEARRLFVENLTGTLQTIAAEARVQVDFNPEVVSRYRLLGYENRDIADDRFRDDTVDAGEIGAGHTVTALYEIKTHRPLRQRDQVATLHLRYASIAAGEMVEQARTVSGRDFAPRFEAASPALQLTALVAEFGELLKGTYWSRTGSLDAVFRLAQQVSADFAGDHEVADFVSLAGQAARLQAAKDGQ